LIQHSIQEKCVAMDSLHDDMLAAMAQITSLHLDLIDEEEGRADRSDELRGGPVESGSDGASGEAGTIPAAASVSSGETLVPRKECPVDTGVIRSVVKSIQQQQLLEMHVADCVYELSGYVSPIVAEFEETHGPSYTSIISTSVPERDRMTTLMACLTYPPYLARANNDITLILSIK
jgi:hypothetical protein